MQTTLAAPLTTPLSWPASLNLELSHGPRGNRLTKNAHHGPLYVQKPFYPEGPDCAHIYLLHPPGGMVSGDALNISLTQQANGHALLTTPGAARVYRARSDGATQSQQLILNARSGSSLEWLPMETLIYPGASTRLGQQVHLSANSHYIGWEIACLGLPECQSPFSHGQFHQTLQIHYDQRLVLHDHLRISGSNDPNSLLNQPIGLAGRSVNGLFVAGPISDSALIDELRVIAARYQGAEQAEVALSAQRQFLIGRYVGHHSEQCRRLFIDWWQRVRPKLIQRFACPPRIWRT